jgi:hypothetical protein
MCRPCRSADEIAIDDGFGHGEIDKRAAGARYFGSDGRVTTALAAFECSASGQNLRTMADGRDGFPGRSEMTNDIENPSV